MGWDFLMKEPWAECGVCGKKMRKLTSKDAVCLKCEECGLLVDMEFVGQFFAPKYYNRIQKVVITNDFSAKIIFFKK